MGKEKKFIIPSILISLLNGTTFPLCGFFLAKIMAVLIKFENFKDDSIDPDTLDYTKRDVLEDSLNFAYLFFALSLAMFFL